MFLQLILDQNKKGSIVKARSEVILGTGILTLKDVNRDPSIPLDKPKMNLAVHNFISDSLEHVKIPLYYCTSRFNLVYKLR